MQISPQECFCRFIIPEEHLDVTAQMFAAANLHTHINCMCVCAEDATVNFIVSVISVPHLFSFVIM